MEVLIIILIVLMIVQTVIYIYSYCVDRKHTRLLSLCQEQMKNAQADFIEEKRKFERILETKDGLINVYASELNKMQKMRDKKGMLKFNLNQKILVELTDKGWENLRQSNTEQFIDHFVKIDGKSYYLLQAHKLGEFLDVVKPVVLMYWSDLEEV